MWLGYRGFVPGVPARDLNAEEVEAYGGADELRRCGLWRLEAVDEEVGDGEQDIN